MAKAKKVSKKKAAKKRPAKKVSRASKSKLRKVPHTRYEIVWDKTRDACWFGSKDGVSGEIGCGVTDKVTVYTDGTNYYVMSVNYPEGYACVEILDGENEPVGICFADSKDVREMFNKDIESLNEKMVCERLAKECM